MEQHDEPLGLLSLFVSHLVGDFDNAAQIERELAEGKQRHPVSKHVTRTFVPDGTPEGGGDGAVYILEETDQDWSYVPGRGVESRPLLFRVTFREDAGKVQLQSLRPPGHLVGGDLERIRNAAVASGALRISLSDLAPSPFPPFLYDHDPSTGDFVAAMEGPTQSGCSA
eukprot:tig00000411_g528.t1